MATVKAPFESNVSSKYGAPMGRHSDPMSDLTGKVHLRCVPFVDGDYDKGGAYWGGGTPLFCAWGWNADGDQVVCYFRATSRQDAQIQIVRALFPTPISFYC